MTLFKILSFVDILDQEGIESLIFAFAPIYHQVTPKHKKKLKLVLAGEEKSPLLLRLIKQEKIGDAVIFKTMFRDASKEEILSDASLLVEPSGNLKRSLIKVAFMHGVPIITFSNDYVKEYIDHTCGMLIRKRSKTDNIEAFSERIEMLYFDPEVQKILSRGAQIQYEDQFSWGKPISNSYKRQFSTYDLR